MSNRGLVRRVRSWFALLWWSLTGGGDRARHAELVRRFPDALVIRSQALPAFVESVAPFQPSEIPHRGSRFSVMADVAALTLWAGGSRPSQILALPWSRVGGFGTRSFRDWPIKDLIAMDGGRFTHLFVIKVDDGILEFPIWGDEDRDDSTHLLDQYGLRVYITRLEELRAS